MYCFSGRYAFQLWKPLGQVLSQTAKKMPTSAFSSYHYKGGFDQKMTKREASLILGISPTSTKSKVRDAHRRIMVLNHPDKEEYTRRTQTLASCLTKTPSTERKEFILDFTRTLIKADILEMGPKFSTFLKKHCKQGGSFPVPSHLRTEYLPGLYPQYKQDIKDAVEGKDIYVILDETTDAFGRCALAILLQPVDKRPVVADLAFLDRVNFTTVSQAVISSLNNNGVDFNNVSAFVSDSASYMKKAFTSILKGLFPNSVYVTCFAHLLSLVLDVFPEMFEDVNRLCALAPQRRLALTSFMLENGHSTVMPVYAVQTRCGSWIRAMAYLAEYMDVLTNFTRTLPETAKTAGADDWHPHTTELLGQLPKEDQLSWSSCTELFQSAMAACSIKLQTVLDKHPCLHMFKSITVLDPAQVVGARKDTKDYVHAVPALSQVSAEEWHRHMGIDKADSME
ncbi:unnamed protein product, partial [Coregonus sp. 'balchen']